MKLVTPHPKMMQVLLCDQILSELLEWSGDTSLQLQHLFTIACLTTLSCLGQNWNLYLIILLSSIFSHLLFPLTIPQFSSLPLQQILFQSDSLVVDKGIFKLREERDNSWGINFLVGTLAWGSVCSLIIQIWIWKSYFFSISPTPCSCSWK